MERWSFSLSPSFFQHDLKKDQGPPLLLPYLAGLQVEIGALAVFSFFFPDSEKTGKEPPLFSLLSLEMKRAPFSPPLPYQGDLEIAFLPLSRVSIECCSLFFLDDLDFDVVAPCPFFWTENSIQRPIFDPSLH